jgi:hypothetical protein
MKTLDQHLIENAAKIEDEAQGYALQYACSIETAREDVRDAYAEGWYDERDRRAYDGVPEDTDCLEDGRDNCNDGPYGEGRYHGRV